MGIAIVKHVSGLEVIGDVEEGGIQRCRVERAFTIVTQQIRATEFGLGVIPICVAAEDSNKGLPVEFDRKDVIGIYPPSASMLENYQRMTGAIITPPRPKLVPVQPNHNKHP